MKSLPKSPQSGIAIMAVAMLLLPLLDVFAKLLTQTMTPGAVGFYRLLTQSVILLPLVLVARQWGRPSRMHFLAGCFLGSALVCMNVALKHMPIANALAIFFVEPLILTLLSGWLLGEGIGWRRLLAVGAGLLGAVLVIRPNWEAFGVAALFPLIAAFCYAGYMLVTRVMTQEGSRLSLQFWIGVSATLVLFAANAIGWWFGTAGLGLSWPGSYELYLIVAMGAFAALCHVMIAHALARAEAGTLAPLQYLEIISGTALGWLVFADFPDWITWIGASIIVCSGIYVFYREQMQS